MAETVKTDNFEAFLVDHGFITQALYEKLREQSANTKQSVLSIIANQKILTPEALAQAKGAFLNIPYVSFKDLDIPQAVLAIIPKETSEFYRAVAFEKDGNSLKVAVTDPTNLQALEALEFFSKKQGLDIQLYVTDDQSFNRVTKKEGDISQINQVVGEALQHIESQEAEETSKAKVEAKEEPLQQLIQDAPISKIVDVILTNAVENSASDIHIEPGENQLRVRYRIDGVLQTTLLLPNNVEPAIVSKIKILANLKIDESRLPQDGRFHFETTGKSVDLRVSILPNVNGEKIVMRILDKTTKVPSLEDLGFRGKALAWVNENIKKTHGILLVTGPTGSGKSTTLYSILSILNNVSVNIVTLEDPVEYFMEGVNQSQINTDIGLTFAAGLRSVLRQDPNIIMVGEIRDKETAELAVHAALTGHLVFSTLHTNNAVGALPRLIDMGIEPFLLTAAINAVAAQRLTRKICPDCKTEMEIPPELAKQIQRQMAGVSKEELGGIDLDDLHLYFGQGCDKCNNTGYRGRIAIVEALPVTPKIGDMVIAKASPTAIYKEGQSLGMISMQQDGIIKALNGLTTYEEVIRVTSE